MRFRYKMGAPGAPGAPESPETPRASGALEAPEIGSYIFLVHATETSHQFWRPVALVRLYFYLRYKSPRIYV